MTTLIKPLLVTIWDKRRIRQQGRVCLAATSTNLKQKRVSSMGHGTKLPQPSMLLRPTLKTSVPLGTFKLMTFISSLFILSGSIIYAKSKTTRYHQFVNQRRWHEYNLVKGLASRSWYIPIAIIQPCKIHLGMVNLKWGVWSLLSFPNLEEKCVYINRDTILR
jgi:hypothetical protein